MRLALTVAAFTLTTAPLLAQWPANQPTPASPMVLDVAGTMQPPAPSPTITAWLDQFCGWQWGGDRERRKFCTDQERDSHAGLMLATDTPKDIRNDCAGKWPVSFTMRLACENVAREAKGMKMVFASSKIETAATSSPQSGSATPIIRAKCAKDFPDDFSTQKYCVDKQTEAVGKLQVRTMSGTDERTIRTKCEKDFPDDFSTRNYCEEQQLKALRLLR